MIDKKTAESILNKLLNSKTFIESPFDQTILQYLVEKSLSGEVPKETTIAIDLFNKSPQFNPSNSSIVRTHIYSLRKKLDHYYLTEGQCEPIRLHIPKGQYEVKFIENPVNDLPQPSQAKKKIFIIAFPILLGLTIFLFFYNWHQQCQFRQQISENIQISRTHPIWKDFFNSDRPVCVVLGDYFAFMETTKKTLGSRRIRDGAINDEADLEAFLKNNPEERQFIADERSHYLQGDMVVVLMDIVPALKLYSNQKITFKLCSALNESDLQTCDLIFCGPLKTLGILGEYMKKLDYSHHFYPHRIRILDQEIEPLRRQTYNLPEELYYSRDFAIVTKLKGDTGNIIFILGAFGPGGIIQTMNFLTSDSFIKEVEQQYSVPADSFPTFFQALVKIDQIENKLYAETIDFRELAQ